MSESSTGHLRNRPRQARSAARVEQLLDAAAEVFEEVGYDAATTNLVAARSGRDRQADLRPARPGHPPGRRG